MASVLLSSVGIGQQFFDNNGVPLAGGLIYTYQAGSTTPLITYQDNGGTIANANPIVLDSAGRVPAEIWLLSGYSYKFIIQSASGASLITLDNLYGILQNAPAVSNTVPSGLIAIWSGSTGSIPSGWQLCDGTNGAPDLRNSFVIGAGNTYAVGATGGATTASLNQGNLPNVNFATTVTDPGHNHTASSTTSISDPGHAHGASSNSSASVSDPGHVHLSYGSGAFNGGGAGGAYGIQGTGNGPYPTQSASTGISVGVSTSTSISGAATGITASTSTSIASKTTGINVSVASGGSSTPFSILPSYYALAFIIKT